jgi:hypothetical protein
MNDTGKADVDKRMCKWFDKDVIVTQVLQRKVANSWVSIGGNSSGGGRSSSDIIPTVNNSGYANSNEIPPFERGHLGLWRLKFSLKTPLLKSDITREVGIHDAYVHFDIQAGVADRFSVSVVLSNSGTATPNTSQYHVWKLGDKADITVNSKIDMVMVLMLLQSQAD